MGGIGSLFSGMRASSSGLAAERIRMDVISKNIANAQTTRAFEHKIEFLLPDVFVQRARAFRRHPPKPRAEIFTARALQKVRVRNAHQVGWTPEEILRFDQVVTLDGFHDRELWKGRKSMGENIGPTSLICPIGAISFMGGAAALVQIQRLCCFPPCIVLSA